MNTSTAIRHGEHATEPPPHMLTDVRFDLVRLDERTPDGRLIHSAGFGVRELPLSFSAMFTTAHGEGEAVIVGSIDEVTQEDDGRVWGQGWLLDEPDARRAGRLMQAGALRGNSVELSAAKTAMSFDEENEKVLLDFLESKLSATTLVANPAMESCVCELTNPEFDFGEEANAQADAMEADLVTLSDLAPACFVAAPVDVDRPPLEWFLEPEGEPSVVSERDGRVSGYIALWDTPHLGDSRIRPPRSESNYAYFTVGEVWTDERTVPTGSLILGGEHAELTLGWRQAIDVYAATCMAWADVAIGENDHGIWVAGMVRPGVDDDVLHAGRASGVSGDWRRIGGALELVAVLSVNAPGFPVRRALTDDGKRFSLTGMGLERGEPDWPTEAWQKFSDLMPTFGKLDGMVNGLEAERIARPLRREMAREAWEIAHQI